MSPYVSQEEQTKTATFQAVSSLSAGLAFLSIANAPIGRIGGIEHMPQTTKRPKRLRLDFVLRGTRFAGRFGRHKAPQDLQSE